MNGPIKCTIRARIGETDALGVVYYGNVFSYFEVARFEFLKALGFKEKELRTFFLNTYVLDARCIFESPIRALDEIEVETTLSELGQKTFKLRYLVSRKGSQEEVAKGYTVGIFVSRNGQSIPIPRWFLDKIGRLNKHPRRPSRRMAQRRGRS